MNKYKYKYKFVSLEQRHDMGVSLEAFYNINGN